MKREMKHAAERPARSGKKHRSLALILAICILSVTVIGGSIAYLTAKSGEVKNTFTPGNVDITVVEGFDGEIKKNVNVVNEGNIDAYVRVKLVTYRVNADGNRIGGTATIPEFTPGTNWVAYGGYYYYTLPVAPGAKPATDLIGDDGIELKEYDDADGGKQVIEVMAEAIQSTPDRAVGEAWGVKIAENSVTAYTAN